MGAGRTDSQITLHRATFTSRDAIERQSIEETPNNTLDRTVWAFKSQVLGVEFGPYDQNLGSKQMSSVYSQCMGFKVKKY